VQLFKQLTYSISQLIYPRLCEGCKRPLLVAESTLCMHCLPELPRTGYHSIKDNESAMRFAGRIPYVHATSLAYFTDDGLLQHLLHGLKYHNKKESGVFLGKQLAYELLQTDWIKNIDLIIPVPLHPKKERERGYNQSKLIADGMAYVLNIPVIDTVLQRFRYTESQTKKSRQERVANMKDAFTISDPNILINKHVMIIDDILTTGATLEACTNAILDISCVEVSIATIGIAID